MRVLVTGGHGFVGSHLVRALLGVGADVRCLYRHEGAPSSLNELEVEIAAGDLNDGRGLVDACANVDRIFHLAGLTRSLSRREMMRTNRDGTSRLLEAAARAQFSGRFVFCSSMAVCAPSRSGTPMTESTANELPQTWYGESKKEAETIVRQSAAPFSTSIVRPPAVYGPSDTDFLTFFKSVAQGYTLVPGDANQRYSLIYAGDVADALLAVSESTRAAGETYFAAHEEIVTLNDMVHAAETSLGKRSKRIRLPRSTLRLVGRVTDVVTQLTGRPSLLGSQRIREVASSHWVCSPAKLAEQTGWKASTSVARGFPQTVAWYREHGQLAL